MNTIDLTPLVEAVISLAVAIITFQLIPFIKNKLNKQEQEDFEYWAKVAVKAAEQMIKGDKRGAERKQYVIEYLEKKGYKLDVDKVEALIESLVYSLNQEKKFGEIINEV